jgi:rhodanese-related sulfurtransferase
MIGWLKSLFVPAGEQIGVQEAVRRLNQGAVLIDVREPGEFAAGHAPQAKHLPLGRIRSEGVAAVDALGIPASTTEALLICQSGMRSRMAQANLSKDTRRRYINVTGGTSAWVASGLPVKRGP